MPVSLKLLLSTVRLPVRFPGALGVNATVNERVPFAGSVTGRFGTPFNGNTALFELMLLTAAGEEPVLTIWNCTELEPPVSVAGKERVPPGSTGTTVCPEIE